MNIQSTKLPDTIRDGFLQMHPQDIKDFFKGLTEGETSALGTLTSEQLTAMQERVKLLKELEHYVSTLPEELKRKNKR